MCVTSGVMPAAATEHFPPEKSSVTCPSAPTIPSMRAIVDTKLPSDQNTGTRLPSGPSSHSKGWMTCGWLQNTASAPRSTNFLAQYVCTPSGPSAYSVPQCGAQMIASAPASRAAAKSASTRASSSMFTHHGASLGSGMPFVVDV